MPILQPTEKETYDFSGTSINRIYLQENYNDDIIIISGHMSLSKLRCTFQKDIFLGYGVVGAKTGTANKRTLVSSEIVGSEQIVYSGLHFASLIVQTMSDMFDNKTYRVMVKSEMTTVLRYEPTRNIADAVFVYGSACGVNLETEWSIFEELVWILLKPEFIPKTDPYITLRFHFAGILKCVILNMTCNSCYFNLTDCRIILSPLDGTIICLKNCAIGSPLKRDTKNTLFLFLE
ncbi:hypothetical protein EDC94DRAFT_580107 [Helicostylum pulchrum]|nr:hypothetical protein EDC94DRAFT_580107 [Helicostylum pulchrum]